MRKKNPTKDIINHRHKFFIGTVEAELLINFKNGMWSCDVVAGGEKIGGGTCGVFTSLEDYIKEYIKTYTYIYNFHYAKGGGYEYAKSQMSN